MPPLSLPESAAASMQVWQRLGTTQRVVLVFTALAVVAGVLGLVSYAGRTDYQTLYSGLGPEDAAAVVAKLDALKVPHRIAEGGTTIQVPAEKLDELRLNLAAEGLPGSGSLGFEIFDRTQLGVTDFTENVNLRRALEGELARTVRGLKEVATARVHVSLPRERPFSSTQGEAKASVVVKLKPGRTLEASNVAAVQQLVASAVEGLKPDAVVVVDDRGTLLCEPVGQAVAAGLNNREMNEKKRFQDELAGNVLAILEPLYGAGHVSTRVNAELDFSEVEETAELYEPERRAIVSEQRAEERGPQALTASGVPGTAANLAASGAAAPAATAALAPPAKLSETKNYEVSKTVRKTSSPRGRLRRISVAVVVDSHARTAPVASAAAPPAAADAAAPPDATPIADAARQPDPQRIASLVTAAVGLDTARGDQVQVEVLPFDLAAAGSPEPVAPPSKADLARDYLREYGRTAGLAAIGLFGYLLLVRPLKREAVKALRAASAPGSVAGASSPAAALAARSEGAQVSLAMAPPVVPAEVRAAVTKAVSADPAQTARFIREWLEREAS